MFASLFYHIPFSFNLENMADTRPIVTRTYLNLLDLRETRHGRSDGRNDGRPDRRTAGPSGRTKRLIELHFATENGQTD